MSDVVFDTSAASRETESYDPADRPEYAWSKGRHDRSRHYAIGPMSCRVSAQSGGAHVPAEPCGRARTCEGQPPRPALSPGERHVRGHPRRPPAIQDRQYRLELTLLILEIRDRIL